jgi:hypothetical protein
MWCARLARRLTQNPSLSLAEAVREERNCERFLSIRQ